MMKNKTIDTLLYADSHDSILRVLQSWRLWIAGAVAGALIAAGVYALFTPPYRARAIVVVDHNLEEVWTIPPAQTFYFLGRETRKLQELAFNDQTMQLLVNEIGDTTIAELRYEILELSQPEDGGWQFWASDEDPGRAEEIASAWARIFVDQVYAAMETSYELVEARAHLTEELLANPNASQDEIQALIDEISPLLTQSKGTSPYLELYVSQGEQLMVTRTVSMAVYLVAGSGIGAVAAAFIALFILKAKEQDEYLAEP